jgi:hypothetical protein
VIVVVIGSISKSEKTDPGGSGGPLNAAPRWGAAIPIPTIAGRRGKVFYAS